MGHIFSQLTNTALTDPSGGAPQFSPKPQQVAGAFGQSAQPSMQDSQSGQFQAPQAPAQPSLVKPTFQQAASLGATPGGANALSPGLTKAGKLVTLLTSGLQGALAGHAASEQAILQSGGHRSGGAGMGFEAGVTLPWQRAQQQAQAQIAQGSAQPVQTPYGQMPAALAAKMFPAQIAAQSREQVAQTGAGAKVGAAQIGAGARTQAAETGAQGRVQSSQISADARVKAAQMGLGPIGQVPQDLQDQFGLPPELPLKMLNIAESAANKPLTVTQGEAGPAVVNKQKGTSRSLGLGAPAMGRAVQAAPDPNNPGATQYMTAGTAARGGAAAPGSAPVQAAKGVLKSATSGKIGEEINAFNTALQHADLLESASKALSNGDTKTLNSLKNRFKTEFGSSDVTNYQTIANAYTREVTKMLSSGHLTDAEIGSTGGTLPSNASPAQIQGAIDSYRALATSKMKQRQNQVSTGMQGKPNFPGAQAPQQTANDPLGIR